MASFNFDVSSYPKPQPAANPMDQVSKIGSMMDVMGNVQVGKAVQGAMDPTTGEIDRNAMANILRQNVAGAAKAIPAMQQLEALRQAGYASDAAGLDTFQKRMALVNHLFGSIASNPNPTMQDVYSIAARVLDPAIDGKKYGITLPVVLNAVRSFRGPDGKPLPPEAIRRRALEIQTMTASTAEQLAAHSPRYQMVDDGQTIRFEPVGTQMAPRYPAVQHQLPPTTQVPTKEGMQYLGPQGAQPSTEIDPRTNQLMTRTAPPGTQNLSETMTGAEAGPIVNAQTGQPLAGAPATFDERFAAARPRGPMAGYMPGYEEAATSEATNSAALGNQWTTAAAEYPAVKSILQNIEREVEGFTPGPGADYKRIAKAFVNANIPVPKAWQEEGGVLDPKSIADQEGFNKFTYELAQRQFAQLGGTGTDAKLNSTMHTSPNELMSKYGIKGVVRILKGNNDAIKVRADAWQKWRRTHGPNSAPQFINEWNQHFDPRVFQFKYIPKSERASWYKTMSREEQEDFKRAAEYARQQGWIKAGGG